MAGEVKSVSVVFQAFTDKFEKKVDGAGKKMGGFVKKAAAFAVGFLGARAAIRGVTDAMRDLESLGRISKTLDVSPDFMRGIGLAAEDVGESFEKAEDLIKEFNIRLGEAGTGAGPAVNGLELIGVTLKDLEKLKPEEKFLKIADAISKISDKQKQIFIAGEFFGGAGEDMLALLNQGEAGLERFIQKARELGGPISQAELDQIHEANQAMKEVGAAIDGIAQTVAISLAPALTDAAEILKGMVASAGDFMRLWSQDNLSNTIVNIGADFEMAQAKLENLLFAWSEEDLAMKIKEIEDRRDAAFNVTLGEDRTGGTGSGDGDGKGGGIVGAAIGATKSFVDASAFQSSKAFDILNPDRPNSTAGQNKAANEMTAKNTAGMKSRLDKLVGTRATITVFLLTVPCKP